MTLTPEDLAKIEARADLAMKEAIYIGDKAAWVVSKDIPALIVALKEAWMENTHWREAVKPFARQAEAYGAEPSDDVPLDCADYINVGDFRRIAALAGEKP